MTREIVIISGKGGTGKTSITAAFASLSQNIILADCDVDAADLHLILSPQIECKEDFIGGKCAVIEPDKCVGCGKCASICRFGAIVSTDNVAKTYRVDEISCEGCGVCTEFCPSCAITMEDAISGQWFISKTRVGPMVHAKLGAGGENSGKLVTKIRNEARAIAQTADAEIILTDGPPGIGCPVIASLAGASMVVIVTEPTMSGISDLERVAKLVAHFKMRASVIINKCDINPDKANEIVEFAAQHNIDVLGQLPYDRAVTQAQIAGKSITEFSDSNISKLLREIWQRLTEPDKE